MLRSLRVVSTFCASREIYGELCANLEINVFITSVVIDHLALHIVTPSLLVALGFWQLWMSFLLWVVWKFNTCMYV